MRPRLSRYVLAPLLGTVIAVSTAGPALAHTEVSIDPARAGGKNAVATVHAEAESDSAGVTKVQIFLPAGITPADITQVSLPKRWKLTRQDTAYTVEGPALAVGTAAEHKVRIRQLPTSAQISFRVLQTYSDGRIDRWIALPSKDDPEPRNPAPTVKLAGGLDTSPTAAPTTAPTSPSAATIASPPAPAAPVSATPSTTAAAAPRTEPASNAQDGMSPWWWIIAVLLVAVLGGGAVIAARKRRRSA